MIKKISYYFFICVLVRLTLAYLVSKNYNNKYRYFLILFYLVTGSGLLIQYIKNDRVIGAFGEKVWWQNYRIIHTILFYIVSYLLYKKNSNTWKLLLLDTLISIFGHIKHNYI
jgi:hypothetical protein